MRWSAVSDARSEHRVTPIVAVAGSIALVAAYPLMPVIGKNITFAGFAALVVIPVLFGYLRRAPGLTAQWLLLLAAMIVGAVANFVERAPFAMPAWQGTAVGTAKGIVNFILLAAAIGVVFHRGRNNLGSLIDAALVPVAFSGLLWNLVVLPGTSAATITTGAQVMLAIILMVLAGTLGALLQLIANDPGNRALGLLFAALALKLVGYVTIAASTQWGPTLGMMAYLGGYVALGLAVLNPAIHRLAEPVPPRPDRLGPARLALLSAALLAVPIAVGLRKITSSLDLAIFQFLPEHPNPLMYVGHKLVKVRTSFSDNRARFEKQVHQHGLAAADVAMDVEALDRLVLSCRTASPAADPTRRAVRGDALLQRHKRAAVAPARGRARASWQHHFVKLKGGHQSGPGAEGEEHAGHR